MKRLGRWLVSLVIKIKARILARRVFGSVKNWRFDHSTVEDEREAARRNERNRLVLEEIYHDHPEFRDQLLKLSA